MVLKGVPMALKIVYNAELYRKSDVLPVNREITIEQAILMAQFQGYKIKSAAE